MCDICCNKILYEKLKLYYYIHMNIILFGGGKGKMKTKIIGIIVCMLLIATALPVAGTVNVRENEEAQGTEWTIIMFVRGKVENISEEDIGGSVYYNCTAVDVKYFWIFYARPFWLEFERRRWWHQDGFLIAKSIFHVIREGLILGIVYNSGEM